MSKIRPKDLPSKHVFQEGITTRVMAKKMSLQSQRDNEENGSLKSRENSRRSLKFLSGTSIPNSTIRASLDSPKNVESNEKIESLHSAKITALVSVNKVDSDKRFSSRGLERMRQEIHSSGTKQETPLKNERRPSNTPLNIYVPQKPKRQSTLESIKDAIDNSQERGNKLVNADSMEIRNVGKYVKGSFPSFEIIMVEDATKNTPPQRRSVQTHDLQTQTSFFLEIPGSN